MSLIKRRESDSCDIQPLTISIWNDKTIADTLQDESIRKYVKSFIGYLFRYFQLSVFFICDITKISTICRKINRFNTLRNRTMEFETE